MDFNNLPIGGMTLVTALVYGAFSLAVTGPLVIDRTIEKSGWIAQCQRSLHEEIRASEDAPALTPQLDCDSIFGMFGREGRRFCGKYGNFNLPVFDQLNDFQRRIQKQREARLDQAAEASAYRCDCAVSVTEEKNRIPFALYAGSARMITPTAVKNLSSELQTSLHSSACAAKQ